MLEAKPATTVLVTSQDQERCLIKSVTHTEDENYIFRLEVETAFEGEEQVFLNVYRKEEAEKFASLMHAFMAGEPVELTREIKVIAPKKTLTDILGKHFEESAYE